MTLKSVESAKDISRRHCQNQFRRTEYNFPYQYSRTSIYASSIYATSIYAHFDLCDNFWATMELHKSMFDCN